MLPSNPRFLAPLVLVLLASAGCTWDWPQLPPPADESEEISDLDGIPEPADPEDPEDPEGPIDVIDPVPVCTEGELRCSGATLEKCGDGAWALAEDCSPAGGICVEGGSTPRCVDTQPELACEEGGTWRWQWTSNALLGLPAVGTAGVAFFIDGFDLVALEPDGSVRFRVAALNLLGAAEEWQAAAHRDEVATDQRGLVYVREENTLHAFDSADGEHQWSFSFDAHHIRLPVTADADSTYVSIAAGSSIRLVALDRLTGDVRWTFEGLPQQFDEDHATAHADVWEPDGYASGWMISQVAVTADRIFVAVHAEHINYFEHTLFALDRTSGEVLWRVDLPWANEALSSSLAAIQPPIVDAEGRVFIVEETGYAHSHPNLNTVLYDSIVHAYDVANGSPLWTRTLEEVEVSRYVPRFDEEGNLQIRALQHHSSPTVFALDRATGAVIGDSTCDQCDSYSLEQYDVNNGWLYTMSPDGSDSLCVMDVSTAECVQDIPVPVWGWNPSIVRTPSGQVFVRAEVYEECLCSVPPLDQAGLFALCP